SFNAAGAKLPSGPYWPRVTSEPDGDVPAGWNHNELCSSHALVDASASTTAPARSRTRPLTAVGFQNRQASSRIIEDPAPRGRATGRRADDIAAARWRRHPDR